ncbi:RICIN domain-containing protein [Streptacidiphilus sp. PAMC 29251]
MAPTLTWATGLYASAFTRVLLNLSYGGGSFPVAAQDQVLASGFAIRRDSLGSAAYFPQSAQDAITEHFPATPVFGENCYQNFVLRPTTSCDGAIATDGLSTVLTRVVADAENIHANTLDLRWPTTDLISWVRDNPGLVQDFALNGGYRLAPHQASYPTSTIAGAAVPIDTTWSNTGVGELPNDLHGWNQKYKVSYALLNPDGTVAAQYVDPNTDPGTWIKGAPVTSTVPAMFNAPAGTYQLATAIVDTTQGNTPAINLALADTPTATGWHPLGALTITPAYTAWSLKNVNSGLAVDDKDGSIAAGNPIIQYPYFGTSNQLWSFQDLGNGYEHVINVKSSMCLTVAGASQADGAGVVQLPCSTDTSQSWALQDVGNGSWRLQAAQSLKCLDVQTSSTSSLAVLVQNACSLTSSQEWVRAGVQ